MGKRTQELEDLYRRRYPYFARVAAAITGDVESGRDAVQTAFATALRKRRSFRGSGPLEAWVWRIVVNEARRVRREAPPPLPAEAPEFTTNGRASDDLGVRAWIATLPERQRAAVFLRYYADFDYAAIAKLLAIEVGTVSATLSAAHATLRKQLEEVER
jgi:RNA polymerase sigma-70 factor (ECF subfamily)